MSRGYDNEVNEMKTNLIPSGLVAVVISAVLLSSCERFGEGTSLGEGKLCISFVEGGELFTKAYVNLPDTSEFLLKVTSSGGAVIYEGKYGDCPEVMEVGSGNYVVRVLSSEFSKPAFDTPQFGDEQCIVVSNGNVANVRLLCRQLNAGVRLVISPRFLEKYPDASLFLRADSGKLMYSYSEKRTAYFKPGPLSLVMSSGSEDKVLSVRELGEREMLSLKVSVQSSDETGSGGMCVSIDTSRVWTSDECVIGSGPSGSDVEDAFSVAEARQYAGREDVWVCGYVVGGDLTSASASFAPPFKSRTNILLGPRSSTKDRKSCISVQLPDGDVRESLNVVDNPEILGRRVLVKGDLVNAYYGIPGMKNTIDFQLL